jgi:HAAS domain-containing protein
VSGLIEDYGRRLERRLDFDRRLARRAREEAEAHLEEAANSAGCECEAIRRFGSPDAVAADYASATLPARLRGALLTAWLLVALTFAVMRLRGLWLGGMSDAPIAVAIDRTGFAAGALLSLAALAIWRRGAADRLPLVLQGAVAALAVSIAAGHYRAGLAVTSFGLDSPLAIVAATGAVELGLLILVLTRLARLGRHIRILG